MLNGLLTMGIFNSKYKQGEDDEEDPNKQLQPFFQAHHIERQETSPPDTSSIFAFISAGTALILANILLAIALKPDKQTLENSPMCGIPSQGEVIFSITVIYHY